MANEINSTAIANKYLDIAGLGKFWTLVKEYVISQKSVVVADHTPAVPGEDATVKWTPVDSAWVTVAPSTDAAGTTTYTVNDGAIQAKMTLIENELDVIKAEAGVTGVKTVDEQGDLVKLTFAGSDTTAEGFAKGDVTITIDDSGLEGFAQTTTANIASVDTSRKNDIAALYGADYEAAADDLATQGAVKGTLAAEGAYNDITKINARLQTIDSSLVTKVSVVDTNADGVNYVDFSINNEAGTGAIVLTVDEQALDNKIKAIDASISAETAARKAKDALLAGEGWDAENDNWKADAAVEYKTITVLSEKLKTAEGKISALTQATDFAGVVTWDPTKAVVGAATADASGVNSYSITVDGVEVAKLQNGDIVIFGNKEFILDANNSAFVELGDTTAEMARLSALEAWVNNPISDDEIKALFAGLNLPSLQEQA